jgi:hypothetical protein
MASFDKVYSVEEVGGELIIKGKPESDLEPKFLAKNPKDGELFLLLGDHGSYSLLKGNVQKGLRFCKAKAVQLFGDCFAFAFEQDGKFGVITDPDSLKRQKPTYDCNGLQKLDVVTFRIVE